MSSHVCPNCHESSLTAIERIKSYSTFYVANGMVEWTGDYDVDYGDAVVIRIECDNCDWSIDVDSGEDFIQYLAEIEPNEDNNGMSIVEEIEDVPDTDF